MRAFWRTVALAIAVAGFLFCTWKAYAQTLTPPGFTPSGQPVVPQSYLTSTSAIHMGVDPANGNDNGPTCGSASGGGACQSIQGAVNKSPKWPGAQTIITAVCGKWDGGAYIENIAPAYTGNAGPNPSAAQSPSLVIQGTLITAVLDGGVSSGLVSASTSGSTLGTGYAGGTFCQTGGPWANNNLVGFWVQIDGGPGDGQQRVIDSNDSGCATIEGQWATTPTTSSGFVIVDSCSEVNATLQEPYIATGVALPPAGIGISGLSAFSISDPLGTLTPRILIQNFKVHGVTATTPFGSAIGGIVMAKGPSTYYEARWNQFLCDTTPGLVDNGIFDSRLGANAVLESNIIYCQAGETHRFLYASGQDNNTGAGAKPNILARWNRIQLDSATALHVRSAPILTSSANHYIGGATVFYLGDDANIISQSDMMTGQQASATVRMSLSNNGSGYVGLVGDLLDGTSNQQEAIYGTERAYVWTSNTTINGFKQPITFNSNTFGLGMTVELYSGTTITNTISAGTTTCSNVNGGASQAQTADIWMGTMCFNLSDLQSLSPNRSITDWLSGSRIWSQ